MTTTPEARAAARRLVEQRGPIPDHLIHKIAHRLRKATSDHTQADKKPA